MVLEAAVTNHVVSRILANVNDEVSDDGEQKIDRNQVYLRSIMLLLAEMAKDRGELDISADKGEFVSFSPNDYIVSYNGRHHFSIFALSNYVITVNTDAGMVNYSIAPGWNQIDPPDGSRITAASPFQGYALYSAVDHKLGYPQSNASGSYQVLSNNGTVAGGAGIVAGPNIDPTGYKWATVTITGDQTHELYILASAATGATGILGDYYGADGTPVKVTPLAAGKVTTIRFPVDSVGTLQVFVFNTSGVTMNYTASIRLS